MTTDRLMTLKEVADLLRVSSRTVRRWVVSGYLGGHILPGNRRNAGTIRIPESSIQDLLVRMARRGDRGLEANSR